jgi:hypothetical protein
VKKLLVVGLGLVVVGTIAVAFFGGNSEKAIAKEEPKAGISAQVSDKAEEKQPIAYEGDKPIYSIKEFTIKASEYSTLDSFVDDVVKNWADGSEYRKIQDAKSAEWTLANSVVHYVNYFDRDIAAKGMTEEFDEWQRLAFDVVKNQDEAKHEELAVKFENKMNEIVYEL